MASDSNERAAAQDGVTMRAVVQDGYGGPEILRIADVPRPVVKDDQVLVRVHAAGLDRGTEHLLTGKPYAARLAFGLRAPRNPVPGRDVAGVVVQTGDAVTRFAEGDEVFGVAPGSFAAYAAGSEAKLAPKPPGLSFAEAAVVPISGGTALQALTDAGDVKSGQSVLVLGASGGVGSYAVQIARASGAQVTAVCSTAKLDYVTSLGAHHVVDYTQQDWAAGDRRYDLILDIAGNPGLSRLRRVLAPRGTVVFVGGEGGGNLTGLGRQVRGALLVSPFVRQRLKLFVAKERGSDFERLAQLIQDGSVTSTLTRSFPLAQAADAMRSLAAGEVQGKVALTL